MSGRYVRSMEFEQAASILEGIPNMSRDEGRRVYDHLNTAGARDVLELGTAHGVSSSYMAAAVSERGGKVTTVDHVEATKHRDPQPGDVIARTGLEGSIERVLVSDSSYTWWLKDKIAERTNADGWCEPAYDFAYIDGAHNWTIDGLAVFLVEKLLRPGGWLLLDDLDWSYGGSGSTFGPGQSPADLHMSDAEVGPPHMQLVFDLIVRQHPAFAEARIENNEWGWAKKDPAAPKRFETVQTRQPAARRIRALARRAEHKARGLARR
jgi:predicted O-methyltransferase YrrM